MPTRDEHAREPSLRKLFLGSHVRAEREEKVLRYIIHRVNESAPLHDVVQEDYVRRNCSPAEIDDIVNAPELVHACREHLWQTFRSGELDPTQPRHTSSLHPRGRSAGREDGGDTLPPGA
jgi:hypothetical protein